LFLQGWAGGLLEVVDVMEKDGFKEMNDRTGKNTVPQIFLLWQSDGEIVEEYIGGYDTIAEW
jgi:glutaredoxin